ncbi:MAG: transposase [bacterium]|nr:transposase [bacterium]
MELYHLLNRGVDKRQIVVDDHDRVRFIHDLFAFNNASLSLNFEQPERQLEQRKIHERLVDIHAFCLMGNHYHLLVSEVMEEGIPLFMQKLNMGYSKYFNERHERTGTLWQGKYKKIQVTRDAHFLYIPYYIHLNPLDFVMPEWRDGKVKNASQALKHLGAYRWSSHLDYLGVKNFPSITRRDLLSDTFRTRGKYEKEIANIIGAPALANRSAAIE